MRSIINPKMTRGRTKIVGIVGKYGIKWISLVWIRSSLIQFYFIYYQIWIENKLQQLRTQWITGAIKILIMLLDL